MVEQAFFTDNLHSLPDASVASRIYFGAEHCPHLLPELAEILAALEHCQCQKQDFTLVTPLCYEVTRLPLEELLAAYASAVTQGEVVVNDWGLFNYLHANFPHLTLVIGRLLTRQKRFLQKLTLSEAEQKHLATIPLLQPRISHWLSARGVKRLELDATEHLLAAQLETNFRFSVYLPYSLLSVSRYCPAALTPEKGWQNYQSCARLCRTNVIYLSNQELSQPLIIKGTSKTFSQPPVKFTADQKIDRLVTLPELVSC